MIRTKLSKVTGFHLSEKESIDSYFHRLDVLGRMDPTSIIKIVRVICEEIEELQKSKK